MSDRLYFDAISSQRNQALPSGTSRTRTASSGHTTGHTVTKKISNKDSSAIFKKILIAIIVALSLIVLAEIVFQLAIANELSLKTINIDSDLTLDHEAVLKSLGVQAGSRFYGIDDAWLKDRLLDLPQVMSANVEKVFPDTLALKLRARQAVVRAVANLEDGRQKMVIIDQRGVVFDWANKNHSNLPLLSGIEFRNFRFGLTLPSIIVPLLNDLQSLKEQSPAVFAAFSEFRLMPTVADGLELLTWTMLSPVPVRIGPSLAADNSVMILRVLSLLGKSIDDSNLQELDFRSPNLVLRRGAD